MIRDLRLRTTLAGRVLGHASLALGAVASGRSRRWLALGGASIAYDLWLARRLRDPAFQPGWAHLAVDVGDTVAWTLSTPRSDPTGPVPAIVATAVPTAAMVGFWAGAGLDASLRAHPREPPPPQTGTPLRLAAARLTAASSGPAAAAALAQRVRGANPSWNYLLHGPVGASFGFALARYRDHLRVSSRRRWELETRSAIDAERAAELVAATTEATPGHDFKKTLLMIGLHGSERARRAAQEQLRHPSEVLESQPAGQTVRQAAIALPIEPPEEASVWLSPGQSADLGRFLDKALTLAPDLVTDAALHVERRPGVGVHCSYLGADILLRNEAPPVLARLDPTALAFAAGAWLATLNLIPRLRTLPPAAVLALVPLDLAGAARFWWRPAADRRDRKLLLSLVTVRAALALGLAARPTATTRSYSGVRVFPASTALSSALLIIGAHWGAMSPRQRLLLPALYGGWLAATFGPRRDRPRPVDVAVELCVRSAALWAFWRVGDLVAAETAQLEVELAAEFGQRAATARLEARRRELDFHERQLRIAREELRLLPATVAQDLVFLTVECDELAAWIEGQRHALDAAAGRAGGAGTVDDHQPAER